MTDKRKRQSILKVKDENQEEGVKRRVSFASRKSIKQFEDDESQTLWHSTMEETALSDCAKPNADSTIMSFTEDLNKYKSMTLSETINMSITLVNSNRSMDISNLDNAASTSTALTENKENRMSLCELKTVSDVKSINESASDMSMTKIFTPNHVEMISSPLSNNDVEIISSPLANRDVEMISSPLANNDSKSTMDDSYVINKNIDDSTTTAKSNFIDMKDIQDLVNKTLAINEIGNICISVLDEDMHEVIKNRIESEIETEIVYHFDILKLLEIPEFNLTKLNILNLKLQTEIQEMEAFISREKKKQAELKKHKDSVRNLKKKMESEEVKATIFRETLNDGFQRWKDNIQLKSKEGNTYIFLTLYNSIKLTVILCENLVESFEIESCLSETSQMIGKYINDLFLMRFNPQRAISNKYDLIKFLDYANFLCEDLSTILSDYRMFCINNALILHPDYKVDFCVSNYNGMTYQWKSNLDLSNFDKIPISSITITAIYGEVNEKQILKLASTCPNEPHKAFQFLKEFINKVDDYQNQVLVNLMKKRSG